MIVEKQENSEFQTSSEMDFVSYRISEEDMSHIMSALSNLYTNTIAALLREYATNAYDGHIEAGIPDRPIDVYLPSMFSKELRIRDYGVGMSPETVKTIFSSYGASSKRSSNDYNGQLGLGSKSALAYSDSFNVTSYVDGIKTVYVNSKNNQGITTLYSEKTEEENGIEVSIPIKDLDVYKFHAEAFNVYRWFRIKPNVHGYDDKEIERPKAFLQKDNYAVTESGYATSHGSCIVMGDVRYPIDRKIISLDEDLSSLLELGLIIDVPVGSVDFTPNRESLRYTEKTKKTIIENLNNVKNSLHKEVRDKIDNAPNLYEAEIIAWNLHFIRRKLERNNNFNFTYKGVPLNSGKIQIETPGVSIRCYKYEDRQTRKFSQNCNNSMNVAENDLFYVNDTDFSIQEINRRVRSLSDYHNCFVISFRDDISKDSFFKSLKYKLIPFKKINTVERCKLTYKGSSTNPKHNSKVFSYNFASYASKNSDCWDKDSLDLESGQGVFVYIDKFLPLKNEGSGRVFNKREMDFIFTKLKQCDIELPSKLYGIKVSQKVKSNNLINFFDWVSSKIKEKLNEENYSKIIGNKKDIDKIQSDKWEKFYEYKDKLSTRDNHIIRLADAIKHIKENSVSDKMEMYNNLTSLASKIQSPYSEVEEKPEFNLKEMEQEVFSKYPLLSYVYTYSGIYEDLVEYVNMKDLKENPKIDLCCKMLTEN